MAARRVRVTDNIAATIDDDGQYVVAPAQQAGKTRDFVQVELADEYGAGCGVAQGSPGERHGQSQCDDDIPAYGEIGVRPRFAACLARASHEVPAGEVDPDLVAAQVSPLDRQARLHDAVVIVDDVQRLDTFFGLRDGVEHLAKSGGIQRRV